MIEFFLILVLAILLDLTLGEPPAVIHPVVWMGKVTSLLVKTNRVRSPVFEFIYGGLATLLVMAIFAIPTYFLLRYLSEMNQAAYVIASAAVFKTTFSLKGLRQAALNIKLLLLSNKLPEARFALRSLVKRDAANLDEGHVASATVESVAENTGDSFVAPLFYFLFFGVPGAMAYRVVNTLDAMIGYHGDYEYLGKCAARLDDVANIIPSRLTGGLIVVSAWLAKKSASGAWRIMWRDGGKTASPNAGWPMSAMAGALGVRLEKIGHYTLGDDIYAPTADDIESSLKIILTAAGIWSSLIVLARVAWFVAI